MRPLWGKVLGLVMACAAAAAHAGSYEDFFSAIVRDDGRAVEQLLLKGFDPNTLDPKGMHGLYLALQLGSLKTAEVLVEAPKVIVEWRTRQDESPLMMAALKGQTELVRKLVDKGADVNKTGWAPLHYAATSGHVAIIELLLEHHAYIDAESPNGSTPLMMAAHYGTREAVKALLDAGADPSLKNQLGLTAVDFAHRANRKDVAETIAAAVRSMQPKGKW